MTWRFHAIDATFRQPNALVDFHTGSSSVGASTGGGVVAPDLSGLGLHSLSRRRLTRDASSPSASASLSLSTRGSRSGLRFAPRDLCGNQIYGAFVLNRRVDLHAIDAIPARPSQDGRVIAEK